MGYLKVSASKGKHQKAKVCISIRKGETEKRTKSRIKERWMIKSSMSHFSSFFSLSSFLSLFALAFHKSSINNLRKLRCKSFTSMYSLHLLCPSYIIIQLSLFVALACLESRLNFLIFQRESIFRFSPISLRLHFHPFSSPLTNTCAFFFQGYQGLVTASISHSGNNSRSDSTYLEPRLRLRRV